MATTDYTDVALMAMALLALSSWLYKKTKEQVSRGVAGYPNAVPPPPTTLPGVSKVLLQALADAIDRRAKALEGPFTDIPSDPEDIKPILNAVLNKVQASAPISSLLLSLITIDTAHVTTDAKGNRQMQVVFVAYEAYSLTSIKLLAKIVVTAAGDIVVMALGPYDSPPGASYKAASECTTNYAAFESLVSPII